MSEWALKRFWTEATVEQDGATFIIKLDDKTLKTPAKSGLILPTRALAEHIAQEWDAQNEHIAPATMPLTCTANAAIDKVAAQRHEVITLLAAYGESDLLCYRAEEPAELQQRQSAAWDPILAWAEEQFSAPLNVGAGVMHIEQSQGSQSALRAALEQLNSYELAAAYSLISISGSLVLALAVLHQKISAGDAWAMSRIDEDWQIEQWGDDEEATALAQRKRSDFISAAQFYTLCQKCTQ